MKLNIKYFFHMFTSIHILCFVRYVIFGLFFLYGQLYIISCDVSASKSPGQSFKIPGQVQITIFSCLKAWVDIQEF